MNDPYNPPQTTAQEYLNTDAKLPWHARLVIGILILSSIPTFVAPVQYIIFLIKTGASLSGTFWLLYVRLIYPFLLLGAAFLLYRRSPHARLPLFVAVLICGWSTIHFLHDYRFPSTQMLYGTYASQFVQFVSMLPPIFFEVVLNAAIVVGAAWYCHYQYKRMLLAEDIFSQAKGLPQSNDQ